MVITVVSDVLGAENNGTTIAAMNLIRYLRSRGHTVRVLCADQYRRGEKDWYIVPNLNLGALLNAYVKKAGVTLAKPDKAVIARAMDGADIVHIITPFALGITAAHMAKKRGLPVTAGFHAQAENMTAYVGMHQFRFANWLGYQLLYRWLFRHVDAIHYPTQFIRDLFEREVHHQTPGYVISNGVSDFVQRRQASRPKEWGDHIVILTTGRYSREKSQDTLLRAAAISRYRDEILLVLAGQGTKERKLKRLAERLPNQPIMKFFGRDEIVDILNACDLYVHPAETELEGIACLEAIACGKLTIVSDSPRAATKAFALDESCVFHNRDPKDLARCIDRWIDTLKNDPEKLHSYENRYAESAVIYRQSECMAEMEKMLTEASACVKA